MRLNFFFYLILTLAYAAFGQNSLTKLPLWPNQNSSVSITKDSNFLVSTYGSTNICLISADLKKIKSIQIKTNLDLLNRECIATNDGLIVTATVSATNTITFRAYNATAGSITPSVTVVRFSVERE